MRDFMYGLIYILMWVWDAAIIGGIGYAVFVLGHSGWWFLLALMLCAGGKSKAIARMKLADKGIQMEENN